MFKVNNVKCRVGVFIVYFERFTPFSSIFIVTLSKYLFAGLIETFTNTGCSIKLAIE